jgi:hypothetical protein
LFCSADMNVMFELEAELIKLVINFAVRIIVNIRKK